MSTPASDVASPRSLAATVYVPAAIHAIGQGAAAPVIALTARELGASVAVAGLMVALWGLGQVLGDLPAGAVVARLGERVAIVLATASGAVGVVLSLAAPHLGVLAVGLVLTGLANAVWGLARMSYLSGAVPVDQRARVMSLFGGAFRLGFFVGPLLGALVILAVGTRGGFVVQVAAVLVSGWMMSRLPDPDDRAPGQDVQSLRDVVVRHRRLLGTLGAGSLLMGAARASRDAVLPLWGAHLGLDAATVSLVFGLGALVDVLCSYPAGHLMDRHGRAVVAVPSLVVMAASYAVVPLTTSLAGFAAAALVLGVGNGFGNGVIMTLGADVAPAATRAEFLAAWRLTHDLGFLAGPLGMAAAASLAPLAVAPLVMAATCAAGAVLMGRYVPVYAYRPVRSVVVAPAARPSP